MMSPEEWEARRKELIRQARESRERAIARVTEEVLAELVQQAKAVNK